MVSMSEAVLATPRPTASPTPYQPCQNSGSTYYEATEDCTGYYICQSGTQGQVYHCSGGGMLYDEAKQMCNWAAEVICNGHPEADPTHDEHGNPLPTKSPTPSPTGKPNELLEWTPKTSVERGHNKTIIAYYASWQWYDRNGLAEPAAFNWEKITRANFAFFQITPQGEIFGTDSWADPITLFGFYDWMAEEGTVPEYCSWDEPGSTPTCMAHHYEEGLIYLAHQAGAEVYPSIGGWSLSDPFPVMAADANARANFARQCVELIKNYNFDGIDLDWEYPGYEPHSGTPEDTVNFNLLLNDVRAALDGLEAETGQFYGLTAALPCGPSIISNQDITHVGRLLTELNLMTYDFHGSWNSDTGVNAPLYDQEDSPEFSVHGCVNNWLEGGAPKEKINIGFPFYGRSFLGAEHLYEPHEGNDETTWHMDEGVPQYYNIMEKMSEYTSVRDEQTMTQYMYGNTGMVSYDDERAICDKTEYAQVHNLNGYIIWEISGDLMPDLSTPLLDAANAKLHNPDMDCADFALSETHLQADVTAGASGAPLVFYYPDYGESICHNDRNQLDWLQQADLPKSGEECCSKHFNWNMAHCLENSPDIPSPHTPEIESKAESTEKTDDEKQLLYYPSPARAACLSDGKQPSWLSDSAMFDTQEECCEHHYSWKKDCVTNASSMERPALILEGDPSKIASASETISDHFLITQTPTRTPTHDPIPRPSRHPTPQPSHQLASQTKRPTMHPTAQPSRHPIRQPVSGKPTDEPTVSLAGIHQNKPGIQTKRPTRRPSTWPARPPTQRPTETVMFNYPLQSPSSFYEIMITEPAINVVQIPNPTGEPTKEPTKEPKERKTLKPTRGNSVQEVSLAASFLGMPTPSFVTEPQINRPSKGSEHHVGDSIKNQIQISMKKEKKDEKGKRGGAKRAKKKKQKQKKLQKRQKKNLKKKQKRKNNIG